MAGRYSHFLSSSDPQEKARFPLMHGGEGENLRKIEYKKVLPVSKQVVQKAHWKILRRGPQKKNCEGLYQETKLTAEEVKMRE